MLTEAYILALFLIQIKNPSSSTFYTNRALCYLKQKKWQQAITDCQHAIEIDPKSVKGHFFLAQAYLEHQLYDEAIANFKQGIKRGFSRKTSILPGTPEKSFSL